MFQYLKAIYSLRKRVIATMLLPLILIALFLHLFYVQQIRFLIADRITIGALPVLLSSLIGFLLLVTLTFFLFVLQRLTNLPTSNFYQERSVFSRIRIRGYYPSSCPLAFYLYLYPFFKSLKVILSYHYYHPYSRTSLIYNYV